MPTTITKLIIHTHPGHGYLQFLRAEAEELGFFGQISSFSMRRGKWLLLEEDCDATLALTSLSKKGIHFEISTIDRAGAFGIYNLTEDDLDRCWQEANPF